MHNCSPFNFRYLRTPMGAVKLVNVVIGAISLILVAVSYVSIWTLAVFTGTVTTCLSLSLFYVLFYILSGPSLIKSKANRVVSFLFHVLAGAALIVAGIELIGWSEYTDPSCKRNCPRLYTVGIAKTLTFMNGTLYLIVGFLGIKDDDFLDPDAADEDIPLLSSKTPVLASIPGSIAGSKQALHNGQNHNYYYYDNFYRHQKVPYDLRSSSSSYRNQFLRPPPHHITAEYSFNNSYNSTLSTYGGNLIGAGTGSGGGVSHAPTVNNGNNGHTNGRKNSKNLNSSVNMTSSATAADLQLIRE